VTQLNETSDVVDGAAARRRMASSKMKRMKQSGCKDQNELEEDNEELFAELGMYTVHSCTLRLSLVELEVVVKTKKNKRCGTMLSELGPEGSQLVGA